MSLFPPSTSTALPFPPFYCIQTILWSENPIPSSWTSQSLVQKPQKSNGGRRKNSPIGNRNRNSGGRDLHRTQGWPQLPPRSLLPLGPEWKETVSSCKVASLGIKNTSILDRQRWEQVWEGNKGTLGKWREPQTGRQET